MSLCLIVVLPVLEFRCRYLELLATSSKPVYHSDCDEAKKDWCGVVHAKTCHRSGCRERNEDDNVNQIDHGTQFDRNTPSPELEGSVFWVFTRKLANRDKYDRDEV
jgi:hypothetical protein